MSMEYTIKRYVGFVSLVVFLLILSTEARADTYGFKSITSNSTIDPAIGEAQLFVDVTEPFPGSDQVLFTFRNVGPAASTIGEVYFDDGALLGIADIYDAPPDVAFVSGSASPPDLPSGENVQPPFEVSAGFLAENDGNNATGVDPDESLGILFNLKDDYYFDDVITAINVGFNPDLYYDDINEKWLEDSLRIGIHVRGFADGESESFIMTPEPGSLLLGSIGIGMVIARCRKRKTLKES